MLKFDATAGFIGQAGTHYARAKGWLCCHPYSVAAVILCLVMVGPFLAVKRDWEHCFLVEAGNLWAGESIYGVDHAEIYPYPPLPALVALPFACLPFTLGNLLFYVLNMACLFVMIRWAWQISGGGVLQGREHVIMLIGLACGVTFALNSLSHHQTDLLIGAVQFAGCLALSRARTFGAATCFGLAAAMKGPDLLWAPYLLWRGRWKEAVWVGVVFVGLGVLPTLIVPAQHQRFLFGEWVKRFVLPMGQSREYPPYFSTESNQSFIGGGYRWLRTTWAWDGQFQQQLPLANPASPMAVRGFVVTWAVMLFLFTLATQGRRGLPCTEEAGGAMRLALECSMVFLLMLLFSPMSGKAHFGTLLLPTFCLTRLAWQRRSRVLGWVVCGALLGVMLSQNFLGDLISRITLWHGIMTWTAVLLLLGCGYGLRQMRSPDNSAICVQQPP